MTGRPFSARAVSAARTLLAAWLLGGCAAEGDRSAVDLAGTWQAMAGDGQMVCDGVQTPRAFTPYSIILRAEGETSLTRVALDGEDAPSTPCAWRYVMKGSRALLDGKQTCAVVMGSTTTTTVWFDDALTLSADGQTLTEAGTFSDATGCTSTATVTSSRVAIGGAGGAGGGR